MNDMKRASFSDDDGNEPCATKVKDKNGRSPERESWSHKADGIITLIAFGVGEGTVLKFPYLCARNGGGAFLVPFLIFTALCALPIYYLEVVTGQYFQRGPVGVWKLCPTFKGIGLGSTIVALIYGSYTSAYFSWYFYYLFFSFFPVLPWSNCDNVWNTDHCYTTRNIHGNDANVTDIDTNGHFNVSLNPGYASVTNRSNVVNATVSVEGVASSAAEEFWSLNVLEITSGLEHPGAMRWPLVGWFCAVICCMFLILFKGIRVSGKVVYATFICPLVLITVLLIRALTLPGAIDGLVYYIRPDFVKLKDPRIWIEACGFALYSMGTGNGGITTLASHNQFSSNCFRDSMIVVFGDAIVTIYCGFAIFSFLGHLAWVKGVALEHFKSGGFNIAFMVFPEAVTYLPLPQVWSVILFLTFITLGLDTTVPCFEVAITLLSDRFPWLARRRWLVVTIVMAPMFLLALPYLTQGGIYMLILVDWYSFVPPIMVFGIIQSIYLTWVFGVDKLDALTKEMYGQPIPRVFQLVMKFITPPLLVIIFSYALYAYRPPKYGNYIFPDWATALGWLLSFLIILPVPSLMAYRVWKTKGTTILEKLKKALMPVDLGRLKNKEFHAVEDSLL